MIQNFGASSDGATGVTDDELFRLQDALCSVNKALED